MYKNKIKIEDLFTHSTKKLKLNKEFLRKINKNKNITLREKENKKILFPENFIQTNTSNKLNRKVIYPHNQDYKIKRYHKKHFNKKNQSSIFYAHKSISFSTTIKLQQLKSDKNNYF